MKNWIYSSNHKIIGNMYFLFSVWSGMIGFSMSLMIRIELMISNYFMKDMYLYNMFVTIHAFIMIFFLIMPFFMGILTNWMIPLMLGVSDLLYPRLNNFSFWLLPFSLNLMIISMLPYFTLNSGWTLYPPLSTKLMNYLSMSLLVFSLHLASISSIISSMNFIISIMNFLKKFNFLSLLLWSFYITSILIILSLPIFSSAVTMLLMDLNMNTSFFNFMMGGDPILFQHLFWFFGHPEVYILIIPGFGIISHSMKQEMKKKEIFNVISMIMAMISIGLLGFIVWAHHMFSTGININTQLYFSSSTMIIAIPTGMKIFSWLMSMNGNKLIMNSELLFNLMFLTMFSIGGMTGMILANSSIDIMIHDSYFVIAHFHYVLSLGALISMLISIIMWLPLIFGFKMNNILLKIKLMIFFFSTNLIFFPQHMLGMMGMPRRYNKYNNNLLFLNFISSFGSIISLFSLMIFMFILWEMMIKMRKLLYNKNLNSSNEWLTKVPIKIHLFNEYSIILFKF